MAGVGAVRVPAALVPMAMPMAMPGLLDVSDPRVLATPLDPLAAAQGAVVRASDIGPRREHRGGQDYLRCNTAVIGDKHLGALVQRLGHGSRLLELRLRGHVRLVQQHEVRALELLGQQSAQALGAGGRVRGRPRTPRGHRGRPVGREGGAVDDGDRPRDVSALLLELLQRRSHGLGLSHTAELHDDRVQGPALLLCGLAGDGRLGPQHVRDAPEQVVRRGAADAAVRQLDAPGSRSADRALQHARVHVHGGQVVHEHAQAQAVAAAEEVLEQGCLPGSQEPGEQDHRSAPGGADARDPRSARVGRRCHEGPLSGLGSQIQANANRDAPEPWKSRRGGRAT
mmetsp:Transcript_5663/g.17870  ORF Transcript_5663/g.17870 Transcript_5663/m.17870 type:complete len:341 (-) Transcript_5663:100-1122(-)